MESGLKNLTVSLLIATMSLGACTTEIIGGPKAHLVEAVEHTQKAIERGKEGYSYALSQHAQVALIHAEAAQRDLQDNAHVQQGVEKLKEAILEGRADDTLKGTKSAEDALKHLKAATE